MLDGGILIAVAAASSCMGLCCDLPPRPAFVASSLELSPPLRLSLPSHDSHPMQAARSASLRCIFGSLSPKEHAVLSAGCEMCPS